MQISQCFYLQIGNSQFSTPFISGNLAPSWIFQLWVLTPVTLPGKQKILLSRICPLWWTRSVDSKEQVIYKTLSSTARIWLANWEGRREKKGRERGEEKRRKQKEIKVNLPLPSLIASFSTINPPFHLTTPSPEKKKNSFYSLFNFLLFGSPSINWKKNLKNNLYSSSPFSCFSSTSSSDPWFQPPIMALDLLR